MLPEPVLRGRMPMTWTIYMFEIVTKKKCKLSLHAQDQVSGERYRTVCPLVVVVVVFCCCCFFFFFCFFFVVVFFAFFFKIKFS